MLKPGDLVELTILKPVVGGRMMARSPEGVVLVAGAIPGERVLARIERATRDVAHAATVNVLEAAATRRPLVRDPACGGLSYAHIEYSAQVQLKREVIADALARIGRLQLTDTPAVTPSSEQGYRLRARFHVRGGRAGWFREGTHDLCSAHGSGQIMEQALDAIDRLVSRLPASVRDAVDTIELAENLPATSRVLHLTPKAGERFGPALAWDELAGTDVTGISWSRQRGDNIEALCGVPWVADVLHAIIPAAPGATRFEVRRHAASFFQANRYLIPALVNAVTRWAGDGLLVDLYAGVGLFAMAACVAGAAEVIAVEGDAVSARDLDGNARPFSRTLRVVRDSVERFLAADRLRPRSTLILDPPRTGISRAAMQGVIAARAARVVYVSCDLATFARDVRRLLDAGYSLAHLEGFDLFPNTGHVEVVAVMDLAKASALRQDRATTSL